LRPPALGTNIFELRLIWSREYVLAIAKRKEKSGGFGESSNCALENRHGARESTKKQEDIPQQEM
jgi:hypothetical protein